jgi:hypothetical protein
MPPRSARRRLVLRTIVALAVAAGSGCQNGETGPSLSASVTNVSLQPTVADLEGGANVCCCHVVGEVTNTSSIAIDAELQFPAKASDSGQLLGTALSTLTNIPKGSTQPFEAVGIPAACSTFTLSQILADKKVQLRGLWAP